MDTRVPVVVRMRVECARCGHTEDDTYEFDMPFAKSQSMEAYEPGKCRECGAPIQMHLKRTQQRLGVKSRPRFRLAVGDFTAPTQHPLLDVVVESVFNLPPSAVTSRHPATAAFGMLPRKANEVFEYRPRLDQVAAP